MNKVKFFALAFAMVACTVPYHGEVVGEDVKRYREMHDYMVELESDYIVVLENLARSPEDGFLIGERDRIGAELTRAKEELQLLWTRKEKAIFDWEKEMVKESAERALSDSLEDSARKRIDRQLRKNGINLQLMD